MRKTIIWVSFSLFLLALVIIAVGTRFVIPVLDDRSMPSGLYVRSFSKPQNGDIVTAKIIDDEANAHGIERGYLQTNRSGNALLLKQIIAVPGDQVSREENQFLINDQIYGEVAEKDGMGRKILVFNTEIKELKPGQYMVGSKFNPNSWDSRYFGPVEVVNTYEKVW